MERRRPFRSTHKRGWSASPWPTRSCRAANRAAGVFVDEESPFPVLAAIDGAEDATFGLWTKSVPQRARDHDIGIARVHQDASEASGLLQPHQRPGLPGIDGFVDAGADRDMA